MSTIDDLKRIAEIEFADIVRDSFFIAYKFLYRGGLGR